MKKFAKGLSISLFRKYFLFLISLFFITSISYSQNCTINTGVPQKICNNDILKLEGTAGGLFQNPVDPITWTQIAGPSVYILNSDDLGSEVQGKNGGDVLTFRLSATCEDGSFVYKDIIHTVLPITESNAGSDQIVCPGTYSLSANTPDFGAGENGFWTVKGNNNGITILDVTDPNSDILVSDANFGTTELVWNIVSANDCVSTDAVIITNLGGVDPVSAGPDQFLGNCFSISQSTILNGTNGGNGTGGQIGTWTVISGPNIPNITNIHANNTSVNNLIEGTYILKWTVSGTCANGEDQVTITVPPPTSDVTSAGNDQIYNFCDSRTEVVFSAPAPLYTNETAQWTQTAGPTAGVVIGNPNNNITTITGLNGTSNYSFQYTITNSLTNCTSSSSRIIRYAQQPTLDIIQENIYLECGESVASIDFATTGDGNISWRIVSGPATVTYPTIPSDYIQVNANPQIIYGLSVSGTYVIEIRKAAATGSQCEAVVDAVSVTVSEEAGLSSAGTAQLLACNVYSTELTGNIPSQGTGSWSQVSGPNNAIFSDIYLNYTTISGLINGSYVFRWIISGGSACEANEVETRVVVADILPTTADAGPDQNNVCIQTPIYLDANQPVLNEQGLWTISPNISGESFQDPTNPQTILDGLIANETYTLTWTIKNSCGVSTDDMIITTTGVIGPVVSNAGSDDCYVTGTTEIVLNGNDPSPGSGLWSLVSGPNTPVIANPSLYNTDVTGITDGTYIFKWEISYNSCAPTVDEVKITVSPETTDADAGSNQSVCDNTVLLNANLPLTGTGMWKQIAGAGGAVIVDPFNPQTVVNQLTEGTYKFEWIITNDACDVKRDTVVVNVSTPPTIADAGSDQNLCGTRTTTLAANAVSNGLWSVVNGPNNPVISNVKSPVATIGNLIMGTYTLKWTSYGGTFCTPSSDIVILSVVPTANAGSDQEYCEATTSVDLAGNVNSTGIWTEETTFGAVITVTSSNTATASNLISGNNYIFKYSISQSGCISSDLVSVNLVPPPPPANAGADQMWCDAATFNLTGNDPTALYTGEWLLLASPGGGTFDNAFSQNAVFTPNPGSEYGVFLFTWKISNGECSNEDQVRVTNYQPPSIAAAGNPQTLVCDTEITMAAESPLSGVGNWTVKSVEGDAPAPNIVSPILHNSVINNLGPQSDGNPATYVFTWTVSNGPLCVPSEDDVAITVYQTPTQADAGFDVDLCNQSGFNLSANNPTIGTGEWINNPAGVSFDNVNLNTAAVSGLTPGATYAFTWEVSTAFCTSTDEVLVTNYAEPSTPNPMANIEICQYGALTLSNITPTVGTGLWQKVSGPSVNILNPNLPTTPVTGITDGKIYVFRYTVSNGICTPKSEDITVQIYQQPTLSNAGPNQQFCNRNTTTLAGNEPIVGTGLWSVVTKPAAALVNFNDDTQYNTDVSGISIPGIYLLRWTISNGTCTSFSDMIITRLEDLSTTNPDDGEICENQTYTLSVTASGGTGPYTYQWEYSSDNISWGNVTGGSGANSRIYTTANNLTVGDHYFRVVVNNCSTVTSTEAIVTVNEIPVVSATNASQEFCSGGTSDLMVLSSTVASSTFSWSRTEPAGITTLQPTSGTGNIPAAVFNNSNANPVIVTYTIYTYGPLPTSCQSAPLTATIKVNPIPAVNSSLIKTICSGSSVGYDITSLTTGATFNWSRASVSGITELGVIGQTNDPILETLTNTTNAPINVEYIITPIGPAPTNCVGTPSTLVVTVNPTPDVIASGQTICSSTATNITLTSNVAGTTFYYAAPTISGAAGNITGGTARTSPGSNAAITNTLVNTTAVNQTATYTVYPVSNGCVGNPFNVVVTVQPEPRVANQTVTVCSNQALSINLPAGTGVAASTFNITAINQNGLTASAGSPSTGNGLSNSVIADDAFNNATNSPKNVIYTIRPIAANGCLGSPFTVTATINPEPQVNVPADKVYCNSDVAAIAFTTLNTGGTTSYAWTNSNINIGLSANGNGNVNFTATNAGSAAINGTIEVTPTFTNNSVACSGNPVTFSITVNPSAQINPIDNQILCNNSATDEVIFSTDRTDGVTTFTWTNTNSAIGLAVSGSGPTIPSFTATNNTTDPISGTIEVTPTYTNNGQSCNGASETFTITVNPTPTVSSESEVTVCSGETLNYIPQSETSSTTYSWVATNTVGTVIGFTASGTGPINDLLTNAGNTEGEITYIITPTGPAPTFCVGPTFSLKVIVANCEPVIGVAKQLVNKVYNEDGTLTATFNIRVQNYGNIQLFDIQVEEDLNDVFGAGNFEVIQLFSTSFDVNTAFNGDTDINLLNNSGTSNILEIGVSTNIELQIKILNPGSYNNTVEVTAESISGSLTDISQNGSDPDPDGDENPGNNNIVTPVVFGSCSLAANVTSNSTCGNAAGAVTLTGSEAGTISLNGVEKASPATYYNLQAGWYIATYTASATACIASINFEITNSNSDLAGRVTSHTDVTCNGLNNGSVTVTPSGGKTPYSYKLNGVAQGSNTFTSLAPGEYGCQITDANGCTYTVSFDIDQPTKLIALIANSNNETCFGLANGSATVVATGGTTPYTYLWSNGQTAATATGLASGNYSVIVTDAKNCTTSTNVTISGAATALAIAGTVSNPTCNGNNSGSIDITVSGGTIPYKYSWSNGFNAEDPTGLTAGSYTIIVTDANGCTATRSFSLTQPAALVLQASGISNTVCNSNTGSVTLSEISNTAGTFTVNGISKTATSATFENLSAGFYTATFTASASGCTAETTFNIINTNSDLAATINVTNPLCNGGTVTATIIADGGNSPFTYSLNGGATQPSGVFTNLPAGSYNVLVTDANDCTYNVGFYIAEPAVLLAGIFTHSDVSCNAGTNGSAMAFATGGTAPYSYSWNTSPVQTTALATNLSKGIYTVTIIDAKNCTSTATVTINEPSLALAISSAAVANPSCFGGSNGSIDITVGGGTPPYSYIWNNGQAGQDANALTAGNYSVTITDGNGCSVTSGTYTLTDPAKIVLTTPLVTDANCDSQEDGSVELAVASGGTSPFTFSLSTGESNTTGVFGTLAAGGYLFTVTDINECTASGAFEIDDPNELELTVTNINDVSCNNGSDGSLTVIATGGTTPYSYKLGSGTPQSSGTFGGLTNGIYVITVTDSKGCSEIETIKISEPTELGIILVNQTNPDCNNSGQIMVSGVGGTAPYVFTSSAGAVSGNLISGLSAGNVTITITDKNNCTETLVVSIIDVDKTAPTFTCPSTQTLAAGINCTARVPDLTVLVTDATDNCSSSLTVSQSIAANTLINSNITVTVIATDESGNTTSCDVLLEIEDTTDPIAVCKDITLQLDMTGRVYISAEDVNNGSADNCGIAGLSIDKTSFDCTDLGSNTVTLTVTDNSGNTNSCTSTVTIEDNITPIIDCPAPVILESDASCTSLVPDFVTGLNMSNNCANVTATQNPAAGTSISTGVTTVTLTATDGTNTSTCTTSVTVLDKTAPTFTCPSTQTLAAGINCTARVPDLTVLVTDATDNCSSSLTVSQSIAANTLISSNITVTVIATDESGNTTSCDVLLEIEDTTDPIAVCKDITLQLDMTGRVYISAEDVNNGSADNCGIAGLSIDKTSFDCTDLGSNTVTLTVTDNSGNTNSCTSTVTIEDNITPIIDCPAPVILESDASCTSLVPDFVTGLNMSNNCANVTATQNPAAGTSISTGVTTVTLTATDGTNTSTCTTSVTVLDKTAPTFTCPSTQTLAAGINCTARVPDLTVLVTDATDNCSSSLTVSQSIAANTLISSNITVTVIATDESGNTTSCDVLLEIEDTTDPIAVCKDITLQLDMTGRVYISAEDVNNGSADNCGIAGLSIDKTSFDCTDLGSNTVTLTVTDNSGNTNSCTSTVTIEDNITPIIDCPAPVILESDASCTSLVPDFVTGLNMSNNCANVTATQNPAAGTSISTGVTTVTLTATDGTNTSTCTTSVTVLDKTAPTFTCPSTQTLAAGINCTARVPDLTVLVTDATDNCSSSLTVSQSIAANTLISSNITVTVIATDESGNTTSCDVLLEIEDTTDPIAVCKDITLQLDMTGRVYISAEDVNNGSADNCGIAGLSIDKTSFDCTDLGSNTVTLTVTDNSGNTNSCTSTVTIEDNITPIIDCPAPVILESDASCTSLVPDFVTGLNMSNNCANVTATQNPAAGTSISTGVTTVTLTATDGTNTSTCTTSVTVLDKTAPTFTCPSTQTLAAGINCTARVPDLTVLVTDATDNCSSSLTVSQSIAANTLINSNITVTVIATDESGNTTSCDVLLEIEDTTDPIAVCKDITLQLDMTGRVYISAEDVNNGSADNCGIAGLSIDKTSFDCTDLGSNTVTLTVTDNSGNTNSCTSTVTIEDNITPIIDCPAPVILESDASCTSLVPDFVTGLNMSNNCANVTATQNPAAGTSISTGVTTVTLTATDGTNTSTCTTSVTVLDKTAPTFTCPSTQTLAAGINCTARVPDLTVLVTDATDNCSSSLTVSQSIAANTLISSNITVTVIATDESGNTTSCDVLLEIEDTTDPIAVCKDITLQLDMTGRVYISAEDVNNGSADNCGIAGLSIDKTSFDCTDLGSNTVTLTVTDNSGNTNSCTSTVTIEDNITPIIDCPAPVILESDASCTSLVPDFVTGLNMSNNCANVTATQNPAAGTSISTGVTTVTLTATDGTNTSTCTTSVTVLDKTAPTFTCPSTQRIIADINCQGTLPDLTSLVQDASDNCSGNVNIIQSIPAGTIVNNDIVVTIKVADDAGNETECDVLVQIDYPDRPIISAGNNAEICSTTGFYTLNGTAVDAERIAWSTSGTGTFNDASTLTAVYTPSKADLLDGQIQLTLTAFGAGRCGIVKDEMVLTIWQQASAYAGRNAILSPNSNYNIYDATASNYESFSWKLIGDGTLLDKETLTPVFVPNPNQTGSVTLVLSVTPYGENICETVTDTMTITIGEAPAISFTKRTVSTIIKADGSIDIAFEFSIENKGNVMLSALSLIDNLANTFTGSCSFEIISILSDNLNLNYNYDGLNNTELLEPNNTLPVGIKKSVLLTVKVQNCDPLVKKYTNVAIARAESPGSSIVNGSDSSEILLYDNPSIGIAKQLVSLILNKDGSYSALFNFRVTNYGDVDLSNVTVYDNLDAVFGENNYIVEEIYSENFAVNTAFAGGINESLLGNSNKLQVGQSGAVMLKLRILSAGNYSNTATATGNNPGGNLFTDTSNDGSDPAPGGGNNPNDFSNPTEIIANDCTVNIICPTATTFTFNNTFDLCGYKIPDTSLDATGIASCTNVDVSHDYGAWGNRHSLSGAIFPVGTTIVTWTARDEIGNSTTCTISVTVLDNEAPEFLNCASGITFTISLFPGACEGGAIWSIPVAKDNCSDVTVVQTRGPAQGSTMAAGTYQVEYRATDASGNSSFCNFNIKVIDTEKPIIVCQPNLKQENDLGKCSWTSTPNSLSPLLANSNCDIKITWKVTNPDGTIARGVNDVSGYTFQLGISTVSYAILEDGSGQSSECSFSVTIVDKQAPEIVCMDDLVLKALPGECSSLIELIPPTVIENCSETAAKIEYRVFNPDNSISKIIPATNLTYEFQSGFSRIEWMVYDKANNYSYCFQNVRVEIDENSVKPDAGPNSTICESDLFNIPDAKAPEFALVNWTTNGTGTFINPTLVNAVYIPSQSDISNGYAMLTITATTGCAVESDQMVLSIFKSPVVSAGSDAVICETENYQVTANVSSGTKSVEWRTTGTGTFSNSLAQNPVYYPSETDIETGSIELIITGIGAGTCANVSDTLLLVIDRQPTVDAGSDAWICEENSFVLSEASVTHSENVLWTTSGTGSFEDAAQINATYYPSTSDMMNGRVILTLTSNSTGPCVSKTDFMVLNIGQQPTASAGNDATICETDNYQPLATVTGTVTGVEWQTSGTGTFSSATALNPIYTPSQADIEKGSVKLVVVAIGSGVCSNASDEMILDIERKAVINAGTDGWICENDMYYLAEASVSNSENVLWSTSGSGTFNDVNLVNATYFPSSSDVINGSVVLTLSNIQSGKCQDVNDNITVSIAKKPTGNAGGDLSTCANQPVDIRNAIADSYLSVYWTHTGTGVLQNANTISPTYVPGTNEKGIITLEMNIVGNNACTQDTVVDALQLQIYDELVVDAGDDVSIFSNTRAKLSVTVENGSGIYFYSWRPTSEVIDPNSNYTETRNLESNVNFDVTVTDAKTGCIATDLIMVEVEENPDAIIGIYNAFSPNGDGVNDDWFIDGIEKFPENEVLIFNRWGDKVKELQNYNNQSVVWNGLNNRNERLPDGTYYYIVKLKEIKSYTGWVHIRSK